MIDRDAVARIEAIERDAWLDIYEAAPAHVRAALGVAQRRLDDGALLVCRAIDHLQFNRLGYLGVTEPARAQAVDAALAEFDAAGVKNWVVHVAESASALAAICAARGLSSHTRSWAKFVRDNAPAPATVTPLAVHEAGGEDARAFGATAAQGFGLPPIVGEWLAALAGRARWRRFIATASSPMTVIYRSRPARCSSTTAAPGLVSALACLASAARRPVGDPGGAHQCGDRERLHASHHRNRHTACRRSGTVLRQYSARRLCRRLSPAELAPRLTTLIEIALLLDRDTDHRRRRARGCHRHPTCGLGRYDNG
jgi:hypothetical protein